MADKKNKFAFDKENYKWMLIGIAILVAGFIIMSLDNTQHGQRLFRPKIRPYRNYGWLYLRVLCHF